MPSVGYDDLTDWDPAEDETPPDTAAVEEAYAAAQAREAEAYEAAQEAREVARALARQDALEHVAYHEAGHAIAAVDCVTGWETALIDGEGGWVRYVAEHYDDTTPANQAYIAWAGSWAEARSLSPGDPWAILAEVKAGGARTDMVRVAAYWDDPAHAPHETEEQWARSLDSLWSHIEALAQRLARERVVRTPLHPEWEA